MTLAEKILDLARRRGMTLRQVSQASGVPYNTLRAYTKPGSRTVPTAPNGIAIAKSLSVPTDWLFDESAGLPAPPRMEMPPFEITPWPPNLITWEKMQQVLEIWLDTFLTAGLSNFAAKHRADPSYIQNLPSSEREALLTSIRYYLEHASKKVLPESDRSWEEITGQLQDEIGPLMGQLMTSQPSPSDPSIQHTAEDQKSKRRKK
jgi:transcriptional regulator with XRE-family HTH domain